MNGTLTGAELYHGSRVRTSPKPCSVAASGRWVHSPRRAGDYAGKAMSADVNLRIRFVHVIHDARCGKGEGYMLSNKVEDAMPESVVLNPNGSVLCNWEQHVRCRHFQQPADRHHGRRSCPSPASPSKIVCTEFRSASPALQITEQSAVPIHSSPAVSAETKFADRRVFCRAAGCGWQTCTT